MLKKSIKLQAFSYFETLLCIFIISILLSGFGFYISTLKKNIFENKNKFLELYRIFEIKKIIKTELNSLHFDFWNKADEIDEINFNDEYFKILSQRRIENSNGQFLGIEFEISCKGKIFKYKCFFYETNLGK